MLEKIKKFYFDNEKIVKIVLAAVLALAFAGSILGAVFGGGEFAAKDVGTSDVKGILRITEADYSTDYKSGDTFVFDMDTCEIMLVAKDPAIENVVRIEKLPKSEFGFQINGEGTIYDDPSKVVMNEGVEFVSVVSTYYINLKTDIQVTVETEEGGNS